MKKFKKLSVMLSLVLCVSMLLGMNTVFAENYTSYITVKNNEMNSK